MPEQDFWEIPLMDISEKLLHSLENGDEIYKTDQIKREFNLRSERNARLLLYIIENNREKWLEKVAKEIKKLENKKLKEFRKISKKMDSYAYQDVHNNGGKLGKLEADICELKQIPINFVFSRTMRAI